VILDQALKMLNEKQNVGKIRLIRSITRENLASMFNASDPYFTLNVGDIGEDKALQSTTIYEKPVFLRKVDLYIYGMDKNKDGGLIIQRSNFVEECEYLMPGQQYKVLSVKEQGTKRIIEVMIRRK
jgi:hypothetical protein